MPVRPATPDFLLAALLSAGAAMAAPPATPAGQVPVDEVNARLVSARRDLRLVPIEQGVADRNAMSTSLRMMPSDLRQPSAFKEVYAVEGRPDLLVRGDGALYAVFPQSSYPRIMVKKKVITLVGVPPGTVYYIGRPDFRRVSTTGIRAAQPRHLDEEAQPVSSSAVDTRVVPTMPKSFADGITAAPLMDEMPGARVADGRIDTWVGDASDPGAVLRNRAKPAADEGRRGASSRSYPGRPGSPASAMPASPAAPPQRGASVELAAPLDEDGLPRAGVPGATKPRLMRDWLYRQERLDSLMQRAAG